MTLLAALALSGASFAQVLAPAGKDPFEAVVAARLAAEEQPTCVAVGVVGEYGRTFIACTPSAGKVLIDKDSIFEIGSFTKVLTGLLLADMIHRGEVALSDPISKYAPPGAQLPRQPGREITLGDLVTHRSSLPRLPTAYQPKDLSNPYKGFDSKALYEALAKTELTSDIGTRQEYSNFGYMLLSDLLGRRAGKRFDVLLDERIFKRLGMASSSVVLTPEAAKRRVQGHGPNYREVPPWGIEPEVAGAGGVNASLLDLMRFADAAAGRRTMGLGPVFETSFVPLINEPEGTSTLFAWGMRRRAVGRLLFHNGQTGGMRTMVVVNPDNGRGAVVLTDSGANLEDLAFNLVDPTMPMKVKRAEIQLDEAKLDEYVGTYTLAPDFELRVFREGSRLLLQATGQQAVPMFAELADRFFLKLVDAQLTFRRGVGGKVVSVVLHQGGRDVPGPRKP